MRIPRLSSLRPARQPGTLVERVPVQSVPMPRFRARLPSNDSLTDMVRLTLNRAQEYDQPFGVFLLRGKVVLSSASSRRYSIYALKHADAMIGTYDGSLDVCSLVDDLRDFLTRNGG